MGFSLKSLVKHVGADINPFDGPRPASTAHPSTGQQIAQQVSNAVQHSPIPSIYQSVPGAIHNVQSLAGLVTGNRAATTNGVKAGFNDFKNNLANDVQNLQQFTTRPAVQVATTVAPHLVKNGTFHPTNIVERGLVGNTPVQNIQQGVRTTYQQHANIPTFARMGLAGLYGAGQVAQDVPVLGSAKSAAKVAKDVVVPSKFAGLPAKQVIMDTRKLDILNQAKNFDHFEPGNSVKAAQQINAGLHQIKQDHGLDFITGSPADVKQRIGQYLEQNGEAIPQLQKRMARNDRLLMRGDPAVAQGGYVQLPGGKQVSDKLYHGSNAKGIEQFSLDARKTNNDRIDAMGRGVYATNNKQYAAGFGKHVYGIENPKAANIVNVEKKGQWANPDTMKKLTANLNKNGLRSTLNDTGTIITTPHGEIHNDLPHSITTTISRHMVDNNNVSTGAIEDALHKSGIHGLNDNQGIHVMFKPENAKIAKPNEPGAASTQQQLAQINRKLEAFQGERTPGYDSLVRQRDELVGKAGIAKEHPLAAEARKYGSAEEFVRQHDTPAFNIKDNPFMAKLAENARNAKSYNDFVNQIHELPIDTVHGNTPEAANTAGLSRTPNAPVEMHIRQGRPVIDVTDGNHRLYAAKARGDQTVKAKFSAIAKNGDTFWGRAKDFYDEANGNKPTKQQLTDIYNQANPKKSLTEKLGIKPLDQSGSASGDSPLMPFNKPIANAAEKLQGKSSPKAPATAKPVQKKIVSSEGSIAPKTTPAPSTKLVPSQPDAAAVPQPHTTKLVSGAPDVGSLGKNTPIDPKQYVKQQIKAQDAARKATTPTGLDKFKGGVANQKSKFIDSLAPIEDKLNMKITAENATGHLTPQLDRVLRADSIAGQYIKDNGLAKVIQKVPDTKEFDQYLIAKHAADLEKNGIKTGRDLGADKQLVDALQTKYEPHAQVLKQYSQGLLDKAVDYGLIAKDLATHLKAKYPNYVPANRIFSEDELLKPPKGVGNATASNGTQTVVQKIKGSDRQIESPLASIISKTQDVIKQGERNKAAQILTSYKDLPGNPFGLRELAKGETVGEKPVISVLDKGVKRQFETTPEVAAAAKSLNKEQLGLIGKILAVPTRVLRLGATGLNPAFAGANVVKDLASGIINSKNPLRSSVANPTVFLKALAAAVNHGSKSYGELVREGAGGTSFDIARDAPKQNVSLIRAQKNVGTKIAYTVTHPSQLFRAAENAIGRSEEFSRALQYYGGKQAAISKGATGETARVLGAHAARNNTVNFARAGDYGRVLNSVLPYLNAGIQGSRTLLRNAGERPVQTAAKLAILGFMPTAATTAWNIATPDRKAAYDDIKDYEKQGNLIIVPPNPKKDASGKWNVIKIPVSQEIANLNNVVRNGIETGMKDGTFKAGQLLGDLTGTVTSLNAQNPRQLLNQATPQAVKPALETVFNQNLFTGNKIVPDSQKNLDPKDQYGPGTSGTARVIGRNLNLSPRGIDNAVRTATGGLGQNVINLTDKGLAAIGKINPADVKGKSIGDSVSGRFSGAQGSSKYDVIDKQTADLTKQLKATPAYQAMNPADKTKALNRLTNAVTGTYTSTKALTPKQQAINNGSVKVSDYLTASKSGGNSTPIAPTVSPGSKKLLTQYNALSSADRTKKSYGQSNYDYQIAKAQYENDKASGKLSKAADISAQDKLAKAAVGQNFSRDVRELYGLNKNDIYDFITSDPNGKKYADQLTAYDKALKAAGITTTEKFKYGFGSKSTGGSYAAGSKKSTGGGTSKTAFASALKTYNTAANRNQSALLNLVKNAKINKSTGKKLNVTRVALKKQSVKKSTYKTKVSVA